MQHEDVLDLLGVDVDAARDDHEELAVGQVQVAVLVEVADVPQRAPAPSLKVCASSRDRCCTRTSRRRGRRTTPRRPRPGPAPAVVVAHVHRAPDGRAHRAGMGQPLLGGDPRHAAALGARVVLVDHRPPPLDHPPLDLGRARRGGMHDRAQAGEVVRPRAASGSLSMRTNMVGTNWAWVTRAGDEVQAVARGRSAP
jgi:hypothetical protein